VVNIASSSSIDGIQKLISHDLEMKLLNATTSGIQFCILAPIQNRTPNVECPEKALDVLGRMKA
jgi:hypothetical protein